MQPAGIIFQHFSKGLPESRLPEAIKRCRASVGSRTARAGGLEEREKKAWESVPEYLEILKDKSIFFMGDNLLEVSRRPGPRARARARLNARAPPDWPRAKRGRLSKVHVVYFLPDPGRCNFQRAF